MPLIVIFDDVEEIGSMLSDFSAKAGFESKFCNQFLPAEASLYREATIIILDLNMPDHDGLDAIETLAKAKIAAPIILCSGVAEDIIDSSVDILLEAGLVFGGKLLKPFSYEQFLYTVHCAGDKIPSSALPTRAGTSVNLTRGDLDVSIKQGWFSQVFQPQIDLESKKLFGVECLARLNHPLFGTCYPDIFIDKLVDYNLMDAFTEHQVTAALNALASINFPADARISINIDPSSLRKDFLMRLESIVNQSSFKPSQICFEITELSAVELSREVKTLLAKLRIRGFHVSLDDFGTGFSTIQELDSLPFNELKIDRFFVSNMLDRKGTMAIIKHTIALAKDMSLLVVAEGIETEKQVASIQELGCQYVQGYYFSKPLALPDLQLFIHDAPTKLK